MRLGLFVAALSIGTGAAGQTTTTNCYTDGLGNTRCTTQSPMGAPQGSDVIRQTVESYQRGNQAANDAWARSMQSMRERRAATEADEQKQTAARIIISGDCAGAQRYALEQGNLALAKEVKDYCGL